MIFTLSRYRENRRRRKLTKVDESPSFDSRLARPGGNSALGLEDIENDACALVRLLTVVRFFDTLFIYFFISGRDTELQSGIRGSSTIFFFLIYEHNRIIRFGKIENLI